MRYRSGLMDTFVDSSSQTTLGVTNVKTKAAILWEVNTPWSVEDIELDEPKESEVLVKIAASGLCHSDEHLITGDLPFELPITGGHAGGRQIADGTARHHGQGKDLGLMCLLGTFAHHTVVHEASCIKIDKDIPLDRACLLGCGVVTGWGSAVYAAEVAPGDVVAVVGVGGIGANAIQGARLAGAKQIWAIDPLENKREKAMEFGATHTAASLEEALPAIQEASWGRMANKTIMTMGVGSGELLASALAITAKRGRVVVTNIHPALEMSANVSLLDLTLMEKQVVGSLFGSANPRADIPKLLELWRQGQLELDGLVTKTYTLDGVNDGYDDMRAGKNIRGVMIYD